MCSPFQDCLSSLCLLFPIISFSKLFNEAFSIIFNDQYLKTTSTALAEERRLSFWLASCSLDLRSW